MQYTTVIREQGHEQLRAAAMPGYASWLWGHAGQMLKGGVALFGLAALGGFGYAASGWLGKRSGVNGGRGKGVDASGSAVVDDRDEMAGTKVERHDGSVGLVVQAEQSWGFAGTELGSIFGLGLATKNYPVIEVLSYSSSLLCGAGLGLNALSMMTRQEVNPLMLGVSALWCASHVPVQATPAVFELTNLDGSNGFKLDGEVSSDWSGVAVSSAGDVNGDSIGDIIIGASQASPGGIFLAGRSYVVFGHNNSWNWTSLLNLTLLNGVNGFKLDGEAVGDLSGRTVSTAGDVNGDSIGDIIIGANQASPGGRSTAGRSYVVFGHSGTWTSPLNLTLLNGVNGFKLDGEVSGGQSGFSVSSAGDINGDSVGDITIGALFMGALETGRTYVVFGHSSGWNWTNPLDLTLLNGANGFKLDGEVSDDQSGFSVSSAGDVNGDSIGDIIIGANQASPGGRSTAGRSYVVFGHNSSWNWNSPLNLTLLNGVNGFKLDGEVSGDKSGSSVSSAGDVNGDSVDDIIIGGGWYGRGRSYVVFGHNSSWNWTSPLNLTTLNGVNGFTLDGGGNVGSAGDVNGDKFGDIITGPTTEGSCVVFGHSGTWASLLNLTLLNGVNGFKLNRDEFGGLIGYSVGSAGDVNGDKIDDIIIGAPVGGAESAGRSYVVFGQVIEIGTLLSSQTGCCVVGIGQPYNFTFAAESFIGMNANDTLAYVVTEAHGNALPNWLNFASATRTFSGIPVHATNIGYLNLKVSAVDKLASRSQNFVLNITQSLSATNIAQAITYTEDESYNLTDIVITTPSSTALVKLTVSDLTAGALTVATSGNVTSTYNPTTGGWQASGSKSDVNVLLAGLQFQPARYFYANFDIEVSITDIYDQSLSSTIHAIGTEVNYPPTVGILLSSQSGCCAIGVANPYNFTFSTTSFTNVNRDVITYNATKIDDTALPSWLSFAPMTQTFSGMTTTANDIGSFGLKVTAINTKWGDSISQTFTLNVTQSLEATNTAQIIKYYENAYYNLVDIVITTSSPTVATQLTLSDPTAGELTVATSGSVTSFYNSATGIWQASGVKGDVNALLSGLTFQPVTNLYKNFTIEVSITDSYGQSLSSIINAIGIEDSPTNIKNDQSSLIGGVVGGIAAVALIGTGAALAGYIYKKKHEKQAISELDVLEPRSWHFDLALKPPLSEILDYILISAGEADIKKVVEAYQRCPVPGMDLKKIKIVYSPSLEQMFTSRVEMLQKKEGNPAFAPNWIHDGSLALRGAVTEHLEKMVLPYKDEKYPAVKLLPVWHGTRPEILDSIFKVGFANLAETDEGFFGKGLYSAYEAKYAYQIYSKGALLINWVSFYSAFPAVDGDMNKLQGKGNYANYDAHFVPVRPGSDDPMEAEFFPCQQIGEVVYHEVVVFDTAQCLPRYLVELQPSLPQSMPAVMMEVAPEASDDDAAAGQQNTPIAAVTQVYQMPYQPASRLPVASANPYGFFARPAQPGAQEGRRAYRTVTPARPFAPAEPVAPAQPAVEPVDNYGDDLIATTGYY